MNAAKMKKRTLVTAIAGTLMVAAAGGAFAYWTNTGAGSGTATTGTSSEEVVVTQTSTASNLYPGTSVALSGKFNNPSTAAQYVTAVTATIDAFTITGDTDLPECTEADFEITGTSNTPGDIPVGTAQGAWSGLSIHMLNRADTEPGDGLGNQDNCKGLTTSDLTITYASS